MFWIGFTKEPLPDWAATNKEAKDQAARLGYDKEVENPAFNLHGHKVLAKGKTRAAGAHNAEPGEVGRVGLLKLGIAEERFVSHWWTWDEKDYVDHWREALSRALAGRPSALVVDMTTPTQSSCLNWWPMWRVRDELVFHNQLFFFKQHGIRSPRLDLTHLFSLIGGRKTHNEEGEPTSEWFVPASDVEKFLKSPIRD